MPLMESAIQWRRIQWIHKIHEILWRTPWNYGESTESMDSIRASMASMHTTRGYPQISTCSWTAWSPWSPWTPHKQNKTPIYTDMCCWNWYGLIMINRNKKITICKKILYRQSVELRARTDQLPMQMEGNRSLATTRISMTRASYLNCRNGAPEKRIR